MKFILGVKMTWSLDCIRGFSPGAILCDGLCVIEND